MKKLIVILAILLIPTLVLAAADTTTATRAASGFPVAGRGMAANVKVAYGTYEMAANVEVGDVYKMCKIPAGATIVGGFVYADDMDTDATETLEMDLGWAANGQEPADADGLGNFGVWVGDAFATPNIGAQAGIIIPFAGSFSAGDLPTFTAETMIQFDAVAVAATFAAGAVSVVVYYTMD